MYRIGQKYKIELKKSIFYTGVILEEDALQIAIKTIRNEELVLNKSEIVQSKLIEQNRIGGINEAGKNR